MGGGGKSAGEGMNQQQQDMSQVMANNALTQQVWMLPGMKNFMKTGQLTSQYNPQYAAGKNALESSYNSSKQQVLENTAPGGGQAQGLTDLAVGRNTNLTGLQSTLASDLYNKIYGWGTGNQLAAGLSGLNSASMNATNMQAANNQLLGSMGQGVGRLVGGNNGIFGKSGGGGGGTTGTAGKGASTTGKGATGDPNAVSNFGSFSGLPDYANGLGDSASLLGTASGDTGSIIGGTEMGSILGSGGGEAAGETAATAGGSSIPFVGLSMLIRSILGNTIDQPGGQPGSMGRDLAEGWQNMGDVQGAMDLSTGGDARTMSNYLQFLGTGAPIGSLAWTRNGQGPYNWVSDLLGFK